MEAGLTKLSSLVLENTKKESVAANNQDLHMLENELKVRKDELLAEEETIARLRNENLILARKLAELEKRNADEIHVLERKFEQERGALKSQVNDLEKNLEGFRKELAAAESSLLAKDAELVELQNNLWELEALRDMKEDQIYDEKQTKLSESQGSVEQPAASVGAALDQPEHHGQVHGLSFDAKRTRINGSSNCQGLVEASLSQNALAPRARMLSMKRHRESGLQTETEFRSEIKAEIKAEIIADFKPKIEADARAMINAHIMEMQTYFRNVFQFFAQTCQDLFARLNPGKPVPQFEIPPFPLLRTNILPLDPPLLRIDQAADSAQQQQELKNQRDD